MRGKQRILGLVVALLALQLGSLISPAYACGCGAMIPDRASRIGVQRETSIVHWDARSRTEQIVMRFSVRGTAREAAWIMPVPGRADVELGDPYLFEELRELTAPEHRTRHYFWPRSGDWPFGGGGDTAAAPAPGAAPDATAPPVGVVGRERLGDFDVARLTATDPDALRDWLDDNGFELPERLSGELRPYVEQKWEYVAVRLAPEERGAALYGTLDPLRIRFASERPVYPMRLSRLATTPQSLGLYVLSEHRMEPRGAIGGNAPEVTYAGEVQAQGAVGELTGSGGGKARLFLTAVEQAFPEPGRIDGDHELRAAGADTPYRRVVFHDRLLTIGGEVPVWLVTVVAVPVAATALPRALRRRRAVRSGA
ncbi:DUF2330 domain-containing protein [Streptomyces sp. NRRL S-118]|uniref:DUF2330 domain-containing protein n=1 Tax=Streptomyces sp. NRRL S-118 TaxID=1463881 RepID=UPI0004C81C70|nr:DUF2330 domain-containing protein [Streptomyces sp. NRRL S-118]